MREIFSLVGRIRSEGWGPLKQEFKTLDKNLTKAANRIDKFGRDVGKIGVGLTKLTAPLTAMGVGITVLAKKTGDYADKLLDLEQITGLNTDTLQEFEHVAREAGVDFEALTFSASRFMQRLPQLVKEQGPAADAVKALGLNIYDANGQVRDMNDLFPEMINRLQSIENTTERNAIAQQLFGRSMKDLAPVLGMTSQQLERVRQQAHDAGLVMSRESIEAANEFRISFEKVQAQFMALGRDLAGAFIPLLQDTVVPLIMGSIVPAVRSMVEWITAAADWFGNLSPFVKDMAITLGAYAVAIGPVLIGLGKMIGLVKTLWVTFKTLNMVMLKNPIMLIITLIGLLVIAGIQLYKHWDEVKVHLQNAWDAIAYAAQQALGFVRMAVFAVVSGILDAVSSVAKWVPGLSDKLAELRARFDALAAAEAGLVYQRRRDRAEAKAQTEENAALAEVVEKAEEATKQYNTTTLAAIENRRKDAKAAEKQRKAEEQLAEQRRQFEEGWTDKLRQAVMTRSQLLEWEYREALSMASEYGVSRQDIELYYTIQRLKLAEDEAKKKSDLLKKEADERKERAREAYSMGVDLVNGLFDVMSMSTDNKIAKLDQETEAQLAAVDASNASEEAKAKRKGEIEAAADKKRRQLQREQAKRDKAAAIFGAIINGALSISKALTLGFPLGLIMAVLFGALAAAQIAMIAAEPLPALARGGVVRSSPGGTHAVVGEGGQDEMILPMQTGVRHVVGQVVQGVKDLVMGPRLPGSLGGAAAAGAGAGGGAMHLHIGTFIGDDSGMRELDRRLLKFRNQELQRKGEF